MYFTPESFYDIDDFINWMILNGLSSKGEEELKFLIRTNEDLDNFLDIFKNDFDNFLIHLSNFREYKIRKNNMTLHQFKYAYELNKKEALEYLFQRPINNIRFIELLERRLQSNWITLDQLYHRHMEDTIFPLARLIA